MYVSNNNEKKKGIEMMERIILFVCLLTMIYIGDVHAKKLDGAGEGAEALSPIWKTKIASDAKPVALKENNKNLAAAGFGMYVRLSKSSTSDETLDTFVAFAKRPGMMNRAAFMLAFRTQYRQLPRVRALIQKLSAHQDAAAHKLAASVLVNLYSCRYVADPDKFKCARNDLRDYVAPDAEFSDESDKVKPNKKTKKKNKVMRVPDIPESLFASSDTDTVTLAMIAAAFSGSKAYHEFMTSIARPTPVQAGAILLYLSQVGDELSDQQVGALFQAALTSTYSSVKNREEHLVNPMFAGGSLACMGLGNLGEKKYLPLLIRALSSKNQKVQMDAIRSIRKIGPDEKSLIAFNSLLKTAEWPVLVELCAAIGEYPDMRLMPGLISRLQSEKGRFRLDLVYALSSIVGEQVASTADEWSKWLAANRDFSVDPAKTKEYRLNTKVQDVSITPLGFFYGVQIFSDHFVYVVDTSLSMRGERIKSLRENFLESLESLESKGGRSFSRKPKVYYNIVDFGGDVVTMDSDGLTDNIAEGKRRVNEMPLTLGTRSYDAMERGWMIENTDSIYFLSDGAPVWGQLETWPSIDLAMDRLFLYRPVAVWMVAFDPHKTGGKAMKTIARENFGNYDAPL